MCVCVCVCACACMCACILYMHDTGNTLMREQHYTKEHKPLEEVWASGKDLKQE